MTESSRFRPSAAALRGSGNVEAEKSDYSSSCILLGESVATSHHELHLVQGYSVEDDHMQDDHELITPKRVLPRSQPNAPNTPNDSNLTSEQQQHSLPPPNSLHSLVQPKPPQIRTKFPVHTFVNYSCLQQGRQKKVIEPCPSLILQQPQLHTFEQMIGMNYSTSLQQGGQKVNVHFPSLMRHRRKKSSMQSCNPMVNELSHIPLWKQQRRGPLNQRMKVVSANRKGSVLAGMQVLCSDRVRAAPAGYSSGRLLLKKQHWTWKKMQRLILLKMQQQQQQQSLQPSKCWAKLTREVESGSSSTLCKLDFCTVDFGRTSNNVWNNSSLKVEKMTSCEPSQIALLEQYCANLTLEG